MAADVSKLFRKKSLGSPPGMPEELSVLTAPETAPAAPPQVPTPVPPEPPARAFKDGRSLRRTGRTVQFSTRISEPCNERFRLVAERDGLMLAQLMELAVDAYEREKARKPASKKMPET
jgi:hypothetical protein